MKSKIKLGVNIDHVATLRQVRGGTTSYPSITNAVELSVKGGADQITIHLREDRRHIQEHDVKVLCQKRLVPINLEMAPNLSMQKQALKYLPDWCCFVPEKREELTTEGGLNVDKSKTQISKIVGKLQSKGIEISMFIEPSIKQVKASYEVGSDAVEFHTGHWVKLVGQKRKDEWKKLVEASHLAHELGMRVHAGHGLDYINTKEIIRLPHLEELNIGHSLICYSIELGLVESVRRMKEIINKSSK